LSREIILPFGKAHAVGKNRFPRDRYSNMGHKSVLIVTLAYAERHNALAPREKQWRTVAQRRIEDFLATETPRATNGVMGSYEGRFRKDGRRTRKLSWTVLWDTALQLSLAVCKHVPGAGSGATKFGRMAPTFL